jgi:hypothetical protein
MKPLTHAQQRELNRITAWDGWAFAGGIRKTEFDAPGAPSQKIAAVLVERGLIFVEDRQVPFFGSITMTVRLARPTDAGWAAATHPPTEWQREYLRRRVHYCLWDWPCYRACLLRGWLEQTDHTPVKERMTVRSVRTKAGLAASKGLLTPA